MSGFLSVSRCPSVKVRVWRSAAGLRGRRWVGSIRSTLNPFSTSANVWLRLRAAKRGWGGRGHLPLRPGGHRATRPGPPHGREPGHAHQSGRDVPSKKRGETSWEGRCERSALEILWFIFIFRESHTSSGTSSMTSWSNRLTRCEPFGWIDISEICLPWCNFNVALDRSCTVWR